MEYSEEVYLSSENPFKHIKNEADLAGTEPEDMSGSVVEAAVPGYWEDMTEKFSNTPFFHKLRVNPEYGIWQYPIAGSPPDMALPNIVGNFFYRRSFVFKNFEKSAVIHFDGVQNAVSVWINDVFLGRHSGYSTPFDMPVPYGVLKNGENTVVLSVSNFRLEGYANEPVSGLTSRAANEFTGGITGNIEIRVYNSPLRDAFVLVSEDCKTVDVKIKSEEKLTYNWAVYDGDKKLKSGNTEGDFTFSAEGLKYWSPESPKLYTLKISCGNSELLKNFGVRKLTTNGVHLKLNGVPYFLRGACEHCYFPETIHPAHDAAYYRTIIKKLKKLGFNFIRFHTYVPEEEYMRAADELGMLLQVECPNNTTYEEWKEIVSFCQNHTSVVIYCCGNELLIDEPFVKHLKNCAEVVHNNTDSLFAPMSAMRGVEYFWCEPEQEKELKNEPFKHHPRRIKEIGEFSDLFCSYPDGAHSYFSLNGDAAFVDKISDVYKKPRLSHEICIDGTYTDLSVKERYKDLKVGKVDMFSSIERHLAKKGILKNAPFYFKNSSEWQRRVRKYCFENVRRSNNIAGYDFLGPIDTHWHTFGYDVGMMNEFYELKPGETERNVLMYNSQTVLLCDLLKKTCFTSGETLSCTFSVSHYGAGELKNAKLTIRLFADGKILKHSCVEIFKAENGKVSVLSDFSFVLPEVDKPKAMRLYAVLDGDDVFAENEWELYLFPKTHEKKGENLVVSNGMSAEEMIALLDEGKDVLLLGTKPFESLPTTFRISLAGRTSGNLATVVAEHPLLKDMPNEGFCGWQFANMLEGGNAVCFESDDVPFNPIIEVVSSHKYVIRQAALFEFCALNGRLLVCGFNFDENDAAACWLKSRLVEYATGNEFNPKDKINAKQLLSLINTPIKKTAVNTNFAFNQNDKTAIRKKK